MHDPRDRDQQPATSGPVQHDGRVGDNAARVDITEAKRFLERLDPGARYFSFQTFDDDASRKNEKLAKVLHGTLGHHAFDLIRYNKTGAGVFVTVNETNGTGRKAEDIIRVRAAFVDLDGSPLEPVTQHHVQPHVIVESSPGKWHAYWLVANMLLEDFTAVQLALIERFKSDPVVKDLPRVMRLPGFFHHKTAVPFRSRIVSMHDREPYPASYFGKAERQQHRSGEKSEVTDLDLWLVIEALKVIPNDDAKWADWNDIGMATYRATDGHDYGRDAFIAWSKKSPKHNDERLKQKWNHYRLYPPTKLGIGTLIMFAKLAEPGWLKRVNEELDDVMGDCDAS